MEGTSRNDGNGTGHIHVHGPDVRPPTSQTTRVRFGIMVIP